MRRIKLVALATVSLTSAMGCELIAGIEDRTEFKGQAGAPAAAGQGGSSAGSAGAAGSVAGGKAGAGGEASGGMAQGGEAGAGGDAGAAGEAGAGGESGAGGDAGAAGMGGEGGSSGGGKGGAGGAAGMAGMAGMGGEGGAGGAGGSTGLCGLSPEGDANLRFANLVPSTTRYDVCFKPKTATDYSASKPVFRGSPCSNGLAYKEVSARIGVPAGIYDVKFINGAAADCSDPGVATVDAVVAKSGTTTDAFLFGDKNEQVALKFSESSAQQLNTAFRFLHAAKGVATIDIGLGAEATAPTTLQGVLMHSLDYQTLGTTSDFGTVDSNGYLQININGATVNVAVTEKDGTEGRLVRSSVFSSNIGLSSFLVGTPADPAFPQELLTCEDGKIDADRPYLARCNGGVAFAQDLSVGTFNAQLSGAFSKYPNERFAKMLEALPASDVDVLCIGETWSPAERDQLAQAAKAKFPHQYVPVTDLDTPVDYPVDQAGNTPPAYTDPPCDTAQKQAALDKLVDCVRDNCATTPGSEDSTTVTGTCAIDAAPGCQSAFAPLVILHPTCFSCALTHLQSFQKLSDVRTQCKTNPKARYAYSGNLGAMILSKKPIKKTETVMLPATEWRVGVLRAEIELENGAGVDVYCSTLTTPANSSTRPYTGQYGVAADGTVLKLGAAWNAENALQTQRMIEFVKDRSRYRKAIVLGETYSGPDYKEGDTQVLTAYTPDSWQALVAGLGFGVVPGYTPACTYCSTNPLVGGSTNFWASHAFLHNLSITAVTSTERRYLDNDVTVKTGDPPADTQIPKSLHYGLRSVVTIEP